MAANENGNGHVPAWLAELGIKPGEYLTDSKLRWKRAMTAKCFSPAARIYACLSLAAAGFQQELAVTMEDRRRVALQPSQVCAQTGVSDKHFREYMEQLRLCGLAEMRGSTKGKVELYVWMVPRPADPKSVSYDDSPGARGNVTVNQVPPVSSLTPEVISILKHYRIRIDPDNPPRADIVEPLALAARRAELSLRAAVNGTRAGDIYKEERNKRNERNNTPLPPPTPPAPQAVPQPESNGHVGGGISPVVAEVVEPPNPVRHSNGSPAPPTALVPVFDPAPSFQVFWNTYRNWRDGPAGDPARWWKVHVTSAEYAAQIIEGLNRHTNCNDWLKGTAIPHALKFLREHWYTRRPLPRVMSKREQTDAQAAAMVRAMGARMRGESK